MPKWCRRRRGHRLQGVSRESFEPVADAGHTGGGLVPGTHTPPRLVQGQLTTNWKQALAQFTAAHPDWITPYL